jgi:DNA-binding NtrC family response regulator
MADGGTLFLDEVTEMAPELQVKLLRVLETRTFRRVGGVEELKVDVRILSSSNRDLDEAVKSGKLRQDFYYRLHVFPITIPPLREHREDIPLLALHFLEQIETRERGGLNGMEIGAGEALMAHDWPGNVRELRNVIHRAFVLSEPPHLRASAVRSVLVDAARSAKSDNESIPLAVGDSLSTAERRLIERTVGASKGDFGKAAEQLGVTQKDLKAKLRKHKLPSSR